MKSNRVGFSMNSVFVIVVIFICVGSNLVWVGLGYIALIFIYLNWVRLGWFKLDSAQLELNYVWFVVSLVGSFFFDIANRKTNTRDVLPTCEDQFDHVSRNHDFDTKLKKITNKIRT